MKNSDKLLLSIIVGFFALFGIINLTLYGLYKTGHVIRESDLFESSPVRKNMPTPGYLSVSDVSFVRLFASDHFAVEYQAEKLKPGKEALLADLEPDKYSGLVKPTPPLSFSQKGDSLMLSVNNTAVTIYFPSIPTILVNNASVEMQGTSHPDGPDCQLILRNCETIIGLDYDPAPEPARYLGALSIQAAKSTIRFEPQLHIRDLNLMFDETSNIEPPFSKVGKLHIQAAGNSTITINGDNINKLLETNKAENK